MTRRQESIKQLLQKKKKEITKRMLQSPTVSPTKVTRSGKTSV